MPNCPYGKNTFQKGASLIESKTFWYHIQQNLPRHKMIIKSPHDTFKNCRHIFFIRHTGPGSLTVKTRWRNKTSRLCLKWLGNLCTLGQMKSLTTNDKPWKETKLFWSMKSMLNLLTNRYLQGGMSGLFYFELRVNCPQTMSIHQTMLMCPFESQKIWNSVAIALPTSRSCWPWPMLSMVFRWCWGHSTIGFNGFQWLWTIGPTMQWF